MHRHLQYGLDFGGFEILPEDAVEDATDSDHGIQQRAAKRRRVEIIAGRCLKGNPPILQSTRLRGPFDNNWKNPWIERSETNKTTEPPTSMEVTKRTLSKKKRTSTKDQPRGKNRSTRSRVNLQEPKGKVKIPSRISSPERPRGATSKSDGSIQPDPTRTLSDGDDSSVATEFFSAQAIQHQHHELPQKDTQWLRRPAKESRIRFGQRTDGISDISPSRSRDSHRPLGARGELQLALPKVPVGATESSGANTDILDSWGTGASASMVISSPIQPTRATVDQPDSCTVMRQETVLSPSKTYHSAMPTQASSTVFVYRKIAGSKSKANNAQKRKPRTMTFSSSPTLIRTTHKIPKEVQEVKAHLEEVEEGQHNIQINSVATGETLVQQTPVHEVNGTLGNKEEAQKPASPSPLRSNVDQVKPQGPPGSSPTKTAVDYSTQAAMLMAQQEFQEGTFPSTFSATLQLWPEIEEHAILSNSSAPSAAMTPASGLRSGPDKSAPPESMLRGPPISTQDLFTAASPFAFSTLKKKRPERSQPSGLRLSLFSNEARDDDQDQEGNATATSPLSTIDRIPLKERNSKLSFRSTAFAKASQSQESPYQAQSNSPSHVELPQLDFHTSLDKLSPDEDLVFTDQFLRNLNAII